jgi:protein-disulfide isomerase
MTHRHALSLMALLALAAGVAAADKAAKPADKPAPPKTAVVATLGGEAIDASELETMGGARLFSIRTQEYQLRKQLLDEVITKRLLEREAKARNLPLADLVRTEVEAKVAPVTEEEQRAFYEQNKARFGKAVEADALKQVEGMLRQQRLAARRAEYVAGLRKAASVRVMLEPPRLKIEADGGQARGPATAPITIVEYADYQCPYCTRAIAALKQVEEKYPGKVRVVFRDFPLTQIHSNAGKAAEAASCASDQGKYWAMHDRLFANQSKLAVDELKKHAVELGLDAAAFDACLDSGKHTDDWKKSLAEGQGYGLTGTPSFFINGRLLVGAQPVESFVQVIDDELERAATPPAERVAGGKKSEP